MKQPPEHALLLLDRYGVAIGQRVVLSSVTLSIPGRGITALVGPMGEGKSTLVRTISGLNDCRPAVRSWGTALFEGRPLEEGRRPTLIIQHLRLLTSSLREYMVSALPHRHELTLPTQQDLLVDLFRRLDRPELASRLDTDVVDFPLGVQRELALARAYATDVPLFCADEPDAGLPDDAARRLLSLLRRIAEERSVLWVTHNQAYARRVSDFVALLAGGRICESQPAASFFEAPRTGAAREYVRTGRCAVPSPMAQPEDIDEGTPPPPPLPAAAHEAPRILRGPTDFFWLLPKRLGGLPRPGICAEVADDLAGLRRLGVTMLVTLEETMTVPAELLRRFDLRGRFFPIPDMGIPAIGEAVEFGRRLQQDLESGEVVALHCRAGMGRTGTMLACQVISNGATPMEALERVRNINPRWIQSDAQVSFLADFARRWPAERSRRAALTEPASRGPPAQPTTDFPPAFRAHPKHIGEPV